MNKHLFDAEHALKSLNQVCVRDSMFSIKYRNLESAMENNSENIISIIVGCLESNMTTYFKKLEAHILLGRAVKVNNRKQTNWKVLEYPETSKRKKKMNMSKCDQKAVKTDHKHNGKQKNILRVSPHAVSILKRRAVFLQMPYMGAVSRKGIRGGSFSKKRNISLLKSPGTPKRKKKKIAPKCEQNTVKNNNLRKSKQIRFIKHQQLRKAVERNLAKVNNSLLQTILEYVKCGNLLRINIVKKYPVHEWIEQSLLREIILYFDAKYEPVLFDWWLKIREKFDWQQRKQLLQYLLKHQKAIEKFEKINEILSKVCNNTDFIEVLLNTNSINELDKKWIKQITEKLGFSDTELESLHDICADISWEAVMIEEFLEKFGNVRDKQYVFEFLQIMKREQVPFEVVLSIAANYFSFEDWCINETFEKFVRFFKKMSMQFPAIADIINKQIGKFIQKTDITDSLDKFIDQRIDKTNERSLKEFEKLLGVLCTFQCSYKVWNHVFDSLIKEKDSSKWVTMSDDLIVTSVFESSFEYDKDKLIDRISEQISDSPYTNPSNLRLDFCSIETAYNGYSTALENSSQNVLKIPISKWIEKDIKLWVDNMKNYKVRIPQQEVVAVIIRAIELCHKFKPRATQILSLLILLNHANGKGRLLQVNTGEGKSLTIVMIAAIYALHGYQVDVITTSTELSIPETQRQRPFFEMLKLTVNENSPANKRNMKLVYECDIVYGTATDFQADLLRTEYIGENCRGSRAYQVAIVDEVDSMLYDNRNNSVRLGGMSPGMIYLGLPLAETWHYVNRVIDHMNGKVSHEQLGSEIWSVGVKNNRHIIFEYATAYSKELFHNPEIRIPTYLQDVALFNVPKWVENAISAALDYKKDAHYAVKDDRIVPVSFEETGVLQTKMVWSNGLTQFLQMKEGLDVDSMGISTNYISNVSFFKRYDSKIYGMTGTLGEKSTQDFLRSMYDLDMVIIPPFRCVKIIDNAHSPYHCKELAPVIVSDLGNWYGAIKIAALYHVANQRGVLIICKFIRYVKHLYNILIKCHPSHKIFPYTGENEMFEKSTIDSGEIIIATNIAGRGTDLKPTNNVEKHGGMCVLVTFLPESYRVEMQNVGRTARQGNRGMAQLIIHDEDNLPIDILRKNRDKKEKEQNAKATQDALGALEQDKQFREFHELQRQRLSDSDKIQDQSLLQAWKKNSETHLGTGKTGTGCIEEAESTFQLKLDKMSQEERSKQTDVTINRMKSEHIAEAYQKDRERVKENAIKSNPIYTKEKLNHLGKELKSNELAAEYVRKAVKESYGLWCMKQKSGEEGTTPEQRSDDFAKYAKEFEDRAARNDLIEDPFNLVLEGNSLLAGENIDGAINCYDKAISRDGNFSWNAHYNKARALLSGSGRISNLPKALEELQAAEKSMNSVYRPFLLRLISAAKQKSGSTAHHLLDILNMQEKYIKKASQSIMEAERKGCWVKTNIHRLEDAFGGPIDRKALGETTIHGLTHLFTIRKMLAAGIATIRSVYSGKLLQPYGSYDNDRRDMEHLSETGADIRWDIEREGDFYTIRNVVHNEYLYAASNYFAYDNHRRRVFTWKEGGRVSQGYWDIQHVEGNQYRVQNTEHKEYLYAAKFPDGSRVFTWRYVDDHEGDNNQFIWTIQ